MDSLTLVVVVHDHQPVGNLDDVFVKAMDRAYRPFLTFLERHAAFRIALHTSGSLLEWMAAHDADYLLRVRALAARGQIELWGGAFFEPILPAIPEADRQGQIRSMANWLDLHLGSRPRGAWLAERVWEPALAGSLADAGVDYTALDDAHFVATGLERDELFGYYLTEDQGKRLAVFPIHRELRYMAPFQPVQETIDWMRRVAGGGRDRMVVLGDDGEKFGLWPGTYERCYTQGWLDDWWGAIEQAGFVTLRTPAEAITAHAPQGLVYLPSTAYHEMGEWSLPLPSRERYERARSMLEPAFGEAAADLLRGGHWRNFLHRYPEANRIHKRTLRVSERLWSRPRPREAAWQHARTHLWRAQCNCPYWHGVFGGLYLPHLRAAVQRELIAAERALCGEGAHGEQGDLDVDGADEVLLESATLAAWVAPAQGGGLFALDDRERLHAYGDTLARRPEAYHARLDEAAVGGGEGETIHAAIRVKESGLARMLRYDTRPRFSFLDHFVPGSGAPPDDAADLSRRAYRVARRQGATLDLVCEPRPEDPPLRVEKHYALDGPRHERLVVRYRLTVAGDRPLQGQFTVECNWALQVPAAPDRYVEIDGARATPSDFAAEATHAQGRDVAFVDAWADRRLSVRASEPFALRRSPVETVSLSEAGVERVFQALETRLTWPVRLSPGAPWTVELTLETAAASAATR